MSWPPSTGHRQLTFPKRKLPQARPLTRRMKNGSITVPRMSRRRSAKTGAVPPPL
ncbi:MAG: hypothetical protein [Siphoviridae sp. ctdEk19]|nr:MAG: hypothetical protein [Siphoviridae sp. ctdEk19]